jgi:hypothetical protein
MESSTKPGPVTSATPRQIQTPRPAACPFCGLAERMAWVRSRATYGLWRAHALAPALLCECGPST